MQSAEAKKVDSAEQKQVPMATDAGAKKRRAPRAPKAPKAPRAPKAPKAPKVPKAPKAATSAAPRPRKKAPAATAAAPVPVAAAPSAAAFSDIPNIRETLHYMPPIEPPPVWKCRLEDPAELVVEAARVRRHFDKLGINYALTMKVREIKARYKDPSGAKNLLPMTEADATMIGAISGVRYRVGSQAAVYLSFIIEMMLNDISRAAIESAIADKKKILHVRQLFARGGMFLNMCRFAPLFKSLPAFAEAESEYRSTARIEDASTFAHKCLTFIKRSAKEAAKSRITALEESLEKESVAALVGELAEDAAQAADDSSFKFYVSTFLRTLIRNEPRYATIRTSGAFRNFLNALTLQLVQKFAMYSKELVDLLHARTVSNNVVLTVLKLMLAAPSDVVDRHGVFGAAAAGGAITVSIVPTAGDRVAEALTNRVNDQLGTQPEAAAPAPAATTSASTAPAAVVASAPEPVAAVAPEVPSKPLPKPKPKKGTPIPADSGLA